MLVYVWYFSKRLIRGSAQHLSARYNIRVLCCLAESALSKLLGMCRKQVMSYCVPTWSYPCYKVSRQQTSLVAYLNWGPGGYLVDIRHLQTANSRVSIRRNSTHMNMVSSKSRDRGLVCGVPQAAKEVVASPMQDKSNVDLVKPVKAAKRRKAAA